MEARSPVRTPREGAEEDRRARLERTWRAPGGAAGWFTAVNQRVVGKRFLVVSFAFFLASGALALLLRAQLAFPDAGLIGPGRYNQLFTMHGVGMMFLFAIPLVEGLGIYLMPMMIGARDMAFPRLNAFGFHVFFLGGVTLFASLLLGAAPDAGWFNYPPLVERAWSPGVGIGVYTTVVTFIEVAALVAAVEQIVTLLTLRAPGMSLDRMPVFAWAVLIVSFMILFAMPGVIVASAMLLLDRSLDMGFYLAEKGGDPLLWQHQFWWFGHPEVYILMIPGFAVVSHVVTTFSRRPLFGYPAVVLSMVATGIVSFGLWVHHMFVVGIPQLASGFFTAASVLIAVPAGVQVFCWIATLWGSRPRWRSPLLFAVGGIVVFLVGGVTGVMVASVPFDAQAHDSYFVVAHLHYVLFGAFVFPMFAAFHYWFPKWTGRRLSERLARGQFWSMFLGFQLAFFPQHLLGLEGMPRRVYTYLPDLGWDGLNLLSSAGSAVVGASVLLFVANAVRSLRSGEAAGDDPWGADTLEWATASPPESFAFRDPPCVEGRHPLWERRAGGALAAVTGLRDDRREVLATSPLDAEPRAVVVLPGPTPWPFVAALAAAVGFVGVILTPWAFVAGFFLAYAAVARWLWPAGGARAGAGGRP